MISATTHQITVQVDTFYQEDFSYPMAEHFMFAYSITIVNNSREKVQLLRRHWFIIDAHGQQREVEGEGVVGEQPILAPGEQYNYISGCDLKTEMGKMYGTYLMQSPENGKLFHVIIPEFIMVAPQKLN